MATVTGQIAKHMAGCKRAQEDTLRDLVLAGKLAVRKHDEAAAAVRDLDAQLEADPGNEELITRCNEYDRLREGLYAASEYGKAIHEQLTGEPRAEPKEVERHDAKDHNGLFTKIGSLGHRLAQMIRG